MENEVTGIVYLRAQLAAQSRGLPYRPPPSPPTGCLTAPLYALLEAGADGATTAAEIAALAKRYRLHAYLAYLIAYRSQL
jgi:hypothetical protein